MTHSSDKSTVRLEAERPLLRLQQTLRSLAETSDDA